MSDLVLIAFNPKQASVTDLLPLIDEEGIDLTWHFVFGNLIVADSVISAKAWSDKIKALHPKLQFIATGVNAKDAHGLLPMAVAKEIKRRKDGD